MGQPFLVIFGGEKGPFAGRIEFLPLTSSSQFGTQGDRARVNTGIHKFSGLFTGRPHGHARSLYKRVVVLPAWPDSEI